MWPSRFRKENTIQDRPLADDAGKCRPEVRGSLLRAGARRSRTADTEPPVMTETLPWAGGGTPQGRPRKV